MGFDERFDGSDLDRAIWTTSYLPAWSSRAESAATYAVSDGALRLSIPRPRACGAQTCTSRRSGSRRCSGQLVRPLGQHPRAVAVP
jgi:hypothetical protein